MMKYNGHAFHKSFDKGKKSGTIEVTSNGITYDNGEVRITLPIQGLSIEKGGAANRLIFLKHPDFNDWTLYTSDCSILKNPIFSQNRSSGEQIKRIQASNNRAKLIISMVLFILLGAIGGFFMTMPWLIDKAAMKIPITWEVEAGKKLFPLIVKDSTIIKNSAINDDFKKITKPILDLLEIHKEFDFEFILVNNPEINAFALPGGKIVVYSGLILNAKTTEEVMGVLAHEASHITLRHHSRGIISRIGFAAVIQLLVSDISGFSKIFAGYASNLTNLKFSRKHEFEADAQGWNYMLKSGYSPYGMIDFFEMLNEKKGELETSIENGINIFSTHPETKERIAILKDKWKNIDDKNFNIINLNFKNFQKHIRKNINHQLPKSDNLGNNQNRSKNAK